MKQIIITLLICMFIYTNTLAADLLGSGVEDPGGKTYIIEEITFEDPPYTDGAELSAASGEGWTESPATTDQFNTSSTYAYAGTQSAQSILNASGNYIYKSHTEQTSTYTIDFRLLVVNAANETGRIGVADGGPATNQGLYLRVTGNDLESYNGTTWDVVTSANDIPNITWVHIEAEVNPSTDTSQIWVDEIKKGTTFDFFSAITAPDQFFIRNFTSETTGLNFYVDNFSMYEGARQ